MYLYLINVSLVVPFFELLFHFTRAGPDERPQQQYSLYTEQGGRFNYSTDIHDKVLQANTALSAEKMILS